MTARSLVLLANARMPSQRAQSMQVAQMAAGFARAGAATTLLFARRHETPSLPPGQDLFDFYAVPKGPRPAIEAVPCVDWIDRTPTRLQFAPARVQEMSFARNAAKSVRRAHPGALVLSREIEAARLLAGERPTFLEVHRVPGGRLRRRWLEQTAPACGGVIAISQGVKDDLVALGLDGARIVVEHDGVDLERFVARPSK